MPQLTVRLLGPPQVELNGAPCDLHSHKALALLAYLAVTRQPQGRAKLAALFWPEQNESRALAYLRHTLWTLRKALGDEWFDSEGEAIALPPHPALWIDVVAFTTQLAVARQANGLGDAARPTDLAALQAAVDLYRDDLLAGFTLRDSPAFDDWHFFEGEALRHQLASALQQLVQGHSHHNDYNAAIPSARRWLALDPLHEPAQQRLMQLYAWSGQRSAALRQYQECVRLLHDELAAPPSVETTQLFQNIQANRLAPPALTPSPASPPPTPLPSSPPATLSPTPPPIPPPALGPTEVRIVTVVCAGFTDLAETQSEALVTTTSRMTGLLQAFQPLLDRYGARIDQRLGDQFLAVFGVYQMHEDDAERAVRAANELQSLARQSGLNLSIGLHTGAVLMHHVERFDQSIHALVMGPVVNLATRLQTQGEAGDILVSKAVYHQSWGAFEFMPVVVTVRGNPRPVTAYLLTGARRHPEKTRGAIERHSPLVGRIAELSHLHALVDQVRQGEGHLVTLSGEAGVGKSRLVAELKTALISSNTNAVPDAPSTIDHPPPTILYLEGRAQEFATTASYWPFLDALRSYLGWQPQASETVWAAQWPAALNQLVAQGALTPTQATAITPLIGRLLGLRQEAAVERQLDTQEPTDLRQQTLTAWRDLLLALAHNQPLLLVLEDLHWADPLSVELIGLLLPTLAQSALLLCAVYRPEADHASSQLGTLARQRCPAHYTELRLHELTPRQSRTLVNNLLVTPDLPPTVQEFILHKAQGNPLFVEELVHALIEMGVLYRADGHWRAQPDLATLALPDTLHNLILTRLERLPAPLRQVLQGAAVIGPRVDTPLLTTLVKQTLPAPIDLAALLPQLTAHAFLLPEPTPTARAYAFRHVLVQEAVYSSLLPAERQRLHGLVALALEQNTATPDTAHTVLLAHHWERADQPHKAISYLQQTADRARVAYAHAEALHCYQRALTLLLAHGGYEQAARTYMKLGLTQQNASDFEAARRAFEEGFALWQKSAAAQPTTAPPTATLRLLFGEPRTLEPAWAGDEMSENVIRQLFSGLVDLTPDLGIVPDLAQSWHVLHGGRTYLFRLRTDVTWSDGAPLTAHDFVYAWRRVLDPANGWWSGQALYAIRGAKAWHTGADPDPTHVGIAARDDYTLMVELEQPTSYFLALLTMTMTLPVPRHLVEKVGEAWTQPRTLVSSGPFLLADWQPGQSLTLVQNPRYHGTRQGNVREVKLAFGTTPTTALQHYEADQLDVLPLADLPTQERDQVRRRHVGEYLLAPRLATIFLVLNLGRPPFADGRIRCALAHATDRVKLAGEMLRGYDFPASGLLPAGMPGAAPDSGLPYDPVTAQRLLAAAGYPHGAAFPAITAWAWPGIAPICEELSRQWQATLGLTITWRYWEWSEFTRRLGDGSPDLFFCGLVVAYPDPDDLLRLQRNAIAPDWQQADYDRLLAEAGRIQDQQRRVDLYRQADRLLCCEAPIIPLLHERLHLLIKPWVRSFPTSALRWSFWKDVIIDPIPHTHLDLTAK